MKLGTIFADPRKMEIRSDDYGRGWYGAPRNGRTHKGVDLITVPGESILSPIDGKIVREAYPYAGDLKWTGCLIRNSKMEVKMFYMKLTRQIKEALTRVGHHPVKEGDLIGYSQNISNKYDDKMIPHVHLELKVFDYVDPVRYW